MRADLRIEQEQRREDQESGSAGEQDHNRVGKDGTVVVVFVEAVADDRIGDRQADQRDQHIRAHFKDLLGIEHEGAVEILRIEVGQQECEYLRAKIPDREYDCIQSEFLVFIHENGPFRISFGYTYLLYQNFSLSSISNQIFAGG